MSKFCSFEDVQKFHELTFKWSVAYDTKSLPTLIAITAPQIVVDFRDFPAINAVRQCTPKEFFSDNFSDETLGDRRLQTQHLLGASVFKLISHDEATGNWQIRARHVRTFANGETADWDASSLMEYRYVKINGEWKISGWRPHTVMAATGRLEDVVGRF
ncbi:hypothetical protein KVR01_004468 [Diaporthe batatas]|uniref:uncharacterized protein n=1 Tax=Diaporthe batatas TaxID=748121 RepID=UPI001D0478B8|nr:uncharacterized protein KVR01_004468 [Diaporthe batatas]KAG8165916.1 hypothetical protein KVR01_004468 [Diaporthe batatas]